MPRNTTSAEGGSDARGSLCERRSYSSPLWCNAAFGPAGRFTFPPLRRTVIHAHFADNLPCALRCVTNLDVAAVECKKIYLSRVQWATEVLRGMETTEAELIYAGPWVAPVHDENAHWSGRT